MNRHGHYQKTSIATEVFQASPHRLIQMLFEGAINNLLKAKGRFEADKVELAEEPLNKASKIVSELQASLDFQYNAELPQNLYYIYDYVKTCMIMCVAKKDSARIDEALNLLKELKSGWDEIPLDVQAMSGDQLKRYVA